MNQHIWPCREVGAPMADSLLLMSLAAQKYQADPLTNALAHIVRSCNLRRIVAI